MKGGMIRKVHESAWIPELAKPDVNELAMT